MELIDRYVKAVSRHLPAARRDDVELELRSALMDELEGRDARSEEEIVAVLREFGDPATVAAAYRPEGQYLIGPELYPSFVRVLGHVLSAVVALCGLWFAVRFATSTEPMAVVGETLLDAIDLAVDAAIAGVLVVTATFVVLQRTGTAVGSASRDFDPRSLPAVLDADRVSRPEAAFSLLVLAVGMAILGAILHEARAGIDRAPEVLRPLIEGALGVGIPWLIAAMLAEAVMQAGLLVEGRWRLGWRMMHVASDVLAVIGFGVAAVAVLEERAALEAIGVPEGAARLVGVSLLVVALAIGVFAVHREHRLTRRRSAELVRPDRPAPAPVPTVRA